MIDATTRSPAATRSRVSVVVPMCDEEDNVDSLMRALSLLADRGHDRHEFEFVLVDDGSRDRTWERLQRAAVGRPDVRLARHGQNRGVAAALMTGVAAAASDVVCTIDCDLSYDPMVLLEMLPMLDGADVVTASPYHPQGGVAGVPRWRLCLSRTLSRLYRRATKVELYTWTSCCRAMRRSSVADLRLDHGGFLGVAEMLVRVLRRGGVVREHPALLGSRRFGVSKMKTLRTIRGHLGLLWRVARGRIG